MSRNTKKHIKFGSFIVLIIYAVVLAYVCFFSEDYGRDVISKQYHYNLIPFREIRRFYIYRNVVGFRAFALNLFGNVIAFMPFGFIIPVLDASSRRLIVMTALTFMLSLTVEVLQLMLKVGSFDVDDLILNTLGGILGYLCFKFLNYLRGKSYGKKRV